jgi:hypothetical protein
MGADFAPTTIVRRSIAGAAFALAIASTGMASAQGGDGEPIDLAFASFFRQPIGPRGLEFSAALRAADGQRVRLVGHVVTREHSVAGRFLFAPRPVRLSEDADGDADDLPAATVTVVLPERLRERVVAPRPGPIAITGRLHVGRAEDASGHVSWLRLDLDPETPTSGSTAATAAVPLAGQSIHSAHP